MTSHSTWSKIQAAHRVLHGPMSFAACPSLPPNLHLILPGPFCFSHTASFCSHFICAYLFPLPHRRPRRIWRGYLLFLFYSIIDYLPILWSFSIFKYVLLCGCWDDCSWVTVSKKNFEIFILCSECKACRWECAFASISHLPHSALYRPLWSEDFKKYFYQFSLYPSLLFCYCANLIRYTSYLLHCLYLLTFLSHFNLFGCPRLFNFTSAFELSILPFVSLISQKHFLVVSFFLATCFWVHKYIFPNILGILLFRKFFSIF